MKYRLIVFDWDGTIIDSASTIAECIRDSARDMGLPVPTHERASHVDGRYREETARMAKGPEEAHHQRPQCRIALARAIHERNALVILEIERSVEDRIGLPKLSG